MRQQESGSLQDRHLLLLQGVGPIVRAIIMPAHCLGLQTVAEGIATEEPLLALRQMGCDLGQGHLCSRPLFLADVPEAIRRKICESAV